MTFWLVKGVQMEVSSVIFQTIHPLQHPTYAGFMAL